MDENTQESFSDEEVSQIKSLVDEVRDRMSSLKTLEEVEPLLFVPKIIRLQECDPH